MSRRYLERGLTGLARAGHAPSTWVYGHFGAVILAGHHLAERASLCGAARAALNRQLDAFIHHHSVWFRPFEPAARGSGSVEEIPTALAASISGLRADGHSVIFATLAMRALREAPHMQTPTVVGGILRLLEKLAQLDSEGGEDLPPFRDEPELISTALEAFGSFESLYGGMFGGTVGHLVTCSHALVELARLGHPDLARTGHGALRAFVKRAPAQAEEGLRRDLSSGWFSSRQLERIDPTDAHPFDPTSAGFWERDLRYTFEQGAGHYFKYSYSLWDLLRSVSDPSVAARSQRQMSYLLARS